MNVHGRLKSAASRRNPLNLGDDLALPFAADQARSPRSREHGLRPRASALDRKNLTKHGFNAEQAASGPVTLDLEDLAALSGCGSLLAIARRSPPSLPQRACRACSSSRRCSLSARCSVEKWSTFMAWFSPAGRTIGRCVRFALPLSGRTGNHASAVLNGDVDHDVLEDREWYGDGCAIAADGRQIGHP